MSSKNHIYGLISLIDDPDDKIYQDVKSKLLGFGQDVIPDLIHEWETKNYGDVFHARIENLIHEIQYKQTAEKLTRWVESGGDDILEGWIIITQYQYPEMDVDRVRKKIAQLQQDVWIEVNDNLTAFEKVAIINRVLFDIYNFNGNRKNYSSPQNSLINNVLDTGMGNPLSLCLIYMMVCHKVNVPVYGVNLPNHFILAFLDKYNVTEETTGEKDEVLFYIDAFSKGNFISRKEIEQFITQLNLKPQPSFFYPCGNFIIIRRMLSNLIYSFEKLEKHDKVKELSELQLMLPLE